MPEMSDRIEGKPTKSEFAEFHPIGTRKELTSLRSRLALLEGLLREATPHVQRQEIQGMNGWDIDAHHLLSRIAAAIEQKGKHPLPEEQKERV